MTTINDTTMQGNISRRSFVKGASALAAGGALAGAFGFDIAHAEGTVDPDAPSRSATRTATCATRCPSAA